MQKIEDYIKSIPDFPKPGVLFRDVTGILDNAEGLRLTLDSLYRALEGVEFDAVAGLEARGFLFGTPIAAHFGKAFIPVRKKGKLPRETVEQSYDLEYGTATIEIHKDAVKPGQKIVIVDDLLATGGTAEAAVKLVESLGGVVVKCLFVIELLDLNGRERLRKYDISSLTQFPGH
ncbi:MAG: adenine phosphoribosyltransferase [Fibrobacter sp.]|jgi:adenine phosphoribosyltransferase|nr:adenine phosphoribosyltransferase [Fibrobacter sp.]